MTASGCLGVDLKSLSWLHGRRETKSWHYLIECLGGNDAIRAPDYCPAPVLAELQGSSTFRQGRDRLYQA